MKTALLSIALSLLLFVTGAKAELVLSAAGVASTIDFTGFTGAGFSPTPGAGQLDSDTWSIDGFGTNVAFGDTQSSGDPARGSSAGGETTGGVYAFDTGGGNVGFGVQPGGSDFTPGDFTLKLLNSTGVDLTSFRISYDVFVYNDQARANSFNLEWSTDDTTYTSLSALDVTSDEAASGAPTWVGNNRFTTVNFSGPLTNGSNFYLRWVGDDVSGSGSRDEFALDNISVTGLSAIPEPTSTIMFSVVIAGIGLRRRR